VDLQYYQIENGVLELGTANRTGNPNPEQGT
jgi:hypothetical protein